MSIELVGNEERRLNLRYCCKIEIDSKQYFGFVTSRYYEYDIQHENKIVYSSKYQNLSKRNIFLNRLTLLCSNSKDDLFKISASGFFGMGRIIEVKDHTIKIPRKFSFALPEIGFEIKAERDRFRSILSNEKDIGIGIGLSYFVWLQQQRWINTD